MKNLLFFLIFFVLSPILNLFSQTNGGSAYLDGSKSIWTSSNDAAGFSALEISGTAITIEEWIYPINIPGPDELYHLVNCSLFDLKNENYYYWRSYQLNVIGSGENSTAGVIFSISDCADPENIGEIEADNCILAEQWNHIATSYDGSYLRIYIDGQLIAEENFTGSIGYRESINSQQFQISIYNGLVDDVRLWNVVRTQSEISANMNSQLTGDEPGLVGYWPLDEAVENVTPDLTANHNDLYAYNQFVNTTPQSAPGSIAHLVVDTSPRDFGPSELQAYSAAQEIEIQNSGDAPLYGEITVENENLVRLYWAGNRYFIDPGASSSISVRLQPLIKEQINSIIDFYIGNADNQGIQIPFAIEGVRELGIDVNNIDMWIQPNGVLAYDYFDSPGPGLEWPKYSEKHVVYSSGVWVGAKVGQEIHTAVSAKSSYFEEFAPGNIEENGQAADPTDPRFHVYKIHLGDNNENPDLAEWPADLGAPVDHNGNPKHLADQTIFLVYNDLNIENHFRLNSIPLGAEIQQTVFAWDEEKELGNTVFLRFKLINKSNDVWEDAYFALWSDPDVGYSSDDFVGIDVGKNMGYAYNGSNQDNTYGAGPPAVGYDIIKGAYYSKPIQAFAYYDPLLPDPFGRPETGPECYNFLQGLNRFGNPYFDPVANKDTVFALNGDPIIGSGWIDSNPGDRRFLLSTGPFDLHPGQAKEIVAAIIVTRDSTGNDQDYLNSITALRSTSNVIQAMYNEGNLFGGAVENVTVEDVDPGATETIDDLENSGAQLDVTAGQEGATVEVASYVEPPPGADEIQNSAIHGVGKYIDVLVNGDIEWPIDIKIYYTQNDLDEAGILEDDLEGIYYWRNVDPIDWYLYSESWAMGDDPTEFYPDTSETGVVKSPEGPYLGYVWAKVYHLTIMRIGTKLDSSLIGIHPDDAIIAKKYYLKQNYPNPFNPSTTIEFDLPKMSNVTLKVFDILGEEVATLVSERLSAGSYAYEWDASKYASGVYLYRLQTDDYVETRKMVLLR